MLKNIIKDSLLYTMSTVLTRGVSFLLLPIYTRAMSPEEFGILDYFSALAAIATIVITLEIMQGLARHIPECHADPEKKRRYASTCMWFTVSSYTSMLILVSVCSRPLANLLLDSPSKSDLVELAAWSCWTAGILAVFNGQLRWELRARASAMLSLLTALLTIACTIFFVIILEWGVKGALIAQVTGGVLALLPSLYLTRSSFGLCFDGLFLRQMLVFSIPLIPSSLAVIFSAFFDRIAIKELMSLSDVGVYAIAQKISMIMMLVLVGFRTALTPLIYTHHEAESTPNALAKIFKGFTFFALVLFIIISVFAKDIIGFVSTPEYSNAVAVVPFLVFGVLLGNMYIFAPGLDISRKTGVVSVINILVALGNLVLNYLLIPLIGIVGAALSSMIAFAGGFVAYMWFSQRLYPVPHEWHYLARMLITTIIGVSLINVIDSYVGLGVFTRILFAMILLLIMIKIVEIKIDELVTKLKSY